MSNEYLIPAEAAALIRQSKGALSRLRMRGDGPPFLKVGAKILYAKTDVIAWLETRRRRSTSDNGSHDGAKNGGGRR